MAHFDSNGDGRLDASDAEWGRFRVWRDLDQDGESDAGELADACRGGDHVNCSLERRRRAHGRAVTGYSAKGSYIDAEGTGALYDAALRYSEYGIREDGGRESVGLLGRVRHRLCGTGTETRVTLDATVLGVIGVVGHDGADRLVAGGDDGRVLVGGGGDDTLEGGGGQDVLVGDDGADQLSGGGGSDVLVVDASDFTTGSVDGGAGFDIAFVEGETGVISQSVPVRPRGGLRREAARMASATPEPGASSWRAAVVTTRYPAGRRGDVLSGEAGADTLRGNGGNDVLLGGEGADSLEGGAGQRHSVRAPWAPTRFGAVSDNDLYVFGRGDGRDEIQDRVVVGGVQREGGTGDVLFLSGALGIGDIVLRLSGGALEIALKDPDNAERGVRHIWPTV